MKESIGGTQLFMIVVVMIVLFTGIIAFTIDRTNAYAIKNSIVSIIEKECMDIDKNKNGKVKDDLIVSQIVETLSQKSYRQTGNCSKFYEFALKSDGGAKVYAFDRSGNKVDDRSASFCIIETKSGGVGTKTQYYYKVVVFYNLDIPIIHNMFNFSVIGETRGVPLEINVD